VPEDQERPDDELLSIAGVCERFGVSRTTLHRLRASGRFPAPEPTQGSTRTRWRASAVAAYFDANPKRPGARTDLQDPG
jgi:predicted DNA-binding transcriptional regulator AlpA